MRHLRLLLWLRWKYLWRSTASRRVAFAIGILGSLVFAFPLGFILWKLMEKSGRLDPGLFTEYAALGGAVVYLGWLYFSSLSDLFDPQRLMVYPIRPTAVFWGSCLSSLIGYMPVHAGWLGIGLVFGREAAAGTLLLRAGLFALLIAHLVMLSRLIRLSFLQLLTSRRCREIAVVVSALIGGMIFLGIRMVTGERVEGAFRWLEEAVERGNLSLWLGWLPSTWFARAFEADGLPAAGWAAAFALATAVIARLGGVVEERLAFSEPVFAYARRKKISAGGPPRFLTGLIARIGRGVGDDVAAVARKEMAVMGRDPAVRSRFITNFFYILIPVVIPFVTRSGMPVSTLPDFTGSALLFLELFFFLNIFGTDGTALRALAAMPVGRRRVILGKNLCHAAVFLPVNAIVISATTAAFGTPAELPRNLIFHAAMFAAVVGAGSLFSIYFPSRMIMAGQRMSRTDDDQGCMMVVLRMAAFLAMAALVSPVAVARIACSSDDLSWMVQSALIGGSVLYAAIIYAVSLRLAGTLFERREEKVIDFFARA